MDAWSKPSKSQSTLPTIYFTRYFREALQLNAHHSIIILLRALILAITHLPSPDFINLAYISEPQFKALTNRSQSLSLTENHGISSLPPSPPLHPSCVRWFVSLTPSSLFSVSPQINTKNYYLGDAPLLKAARSEARNNFRSNISLSAGSPEALAAVKHAEEVGLSLFSLLKPYICLSIEDIHGESNLFHR